MFEDKTFPLHKQAASTSGIQQDVGDHHSETVPPEMTQPSTPSFTSSKTETSHQSDPSVTGNEGNDSFAPNAKELEE